MKIKSHIFFLLLAMISCEQKSRSDQTSAVRIDTTTIERERPINVEFDKHVTIFKYDSSYSDSNMITELWYKSDSFLSGEKFYHTIPFESDFVYSNIIEAAGGNSEFETFDSTICETGGASAWNKYLFEYDNMQRPKIVEHYKAWWNEQIDFNRPEKPAYFLSEKVKYEYGENWTKQHAFNQEGALIETIEKRYDAKERLVYDHWDAWNTHRFKVFYSYPD